MRQIVLLVEQSDDGEFTARTMDRSLCATAATMDDLRSNIIAELVTQGDQTVFPCKIRFEFCRVRTSTLLGYFGAVCAWILEIATLLVHLLSGNNIPLVVQILLTSATCALSIFAWRRRDDFRALRVSGGRVYLTASQTLIVTSVVVGISLFGVGLIALFVALTS